MKKIKSNSCFQLVMLMISATLLVLFVVMPLCSVLLKAFQNRDGRFIGFYNFGEYFSSPNLVGSLGNSIYVSLMTTVIVVILAFGYAYALSRTRIKGKGLLKLSAMLPLFAPTMMLGIGLIYLIGNKGMITALGIKLPLYGSLGIIVSEVVYAFPQAFLILLVSLSFSDNRLYEAADVMGTTNLRKFLTITVPNVKYGLVSAAFVAFTLSFTDFGAPKVVGGNFNVLATDVYKQVVGQQNFIMGSVVGIILMLPAIISFVIDRFTTSKTDNAINAKTIAYIIKPNKMRDIIATVYCSLINLCIFAIFGAVIFASFVKTWPYDLSLTFKHYLTNSPTTGGIGSYFNSITVSALTAIIGTVFVFITAYLIEKTRDTKLLKQVTYFLSIIPLALPGLVIGIAYIFFFSNPANPLHFLYGSIGIIVLSNIVHFYSVPFVTATSALKKLDREFELVSESMNVPFYKTFFKVTVPMSLPAILEILIFYFVNSMATVSAVVFLYPANFKLASIAIVNMEDAGDIAPAAALSVLIILTNVIVRLLYEVITAKIKNRRKA